MSVKSVVTEFAGQAGVTPRLVRIICDNSFSEITAAGFLNNNAANVGISFLTSDFVFVSYTGGNNMFTLSFATDGVITMVAEGSDIALPTIANHLAVFLNTSGKLGEDVATAINSGNIQAGLSGTAGYLASFPGTASKGSLRLTGVANTGNTVTTISNAAMGQASVISIPDPGVATSNFILSDNAGTQTIATGSLALTLGSVTATAGNLQAGSSGNAGTVSSFPGTASKGKLIFAGVANTGNTNVTISNAAHGQASVYSIPDSGVATSTFIMADNATGQTIATGNLTLTAGNVVVTAGSITTTNGGIIQSGSSANAGSIKVFPTTASKGNLKIACADQTGNTEVTLAPVAMGQATAVNISDPGAATGYLNTSTVNASTTPVGAFFIKEIALTAAALATSGHVSIQTSSGAMQFKVRDILVNYSAAGLSGGGGDRLVNVTDGTTIYNNAGITAALLGTPVNTVWGGTGNPLPGTVAMNTATAAAAALYAVYAGGTTDYTTGTVNITVSLERVA